MGDGISFEEVLTVITVLLLLRVVFLVPVVSLDRIKTESAAVDQYWKRQAAHVLDNADENEEVLPYRVAFGLRDVRATLTQADDRVWIEAAAHDGDNLIVVRHTPAGGNFVALRVQQAGAVRTFRRGTLLWSERENEWFVGGDTVDYGAHPTSVELEREFRAWTKRERGY